MQYTNLIVLGDQDVYSNMSGVLRPIRPSQRLDPSGNSAWAFGAESGRIGLGCLR